jgi:predicted nucleic acid-binding protein
VIYVDSSVALAHLFREPRSPPASFWGQLLLSSSLLEFEVWNRVHAYGLADSHSTEAQALLARVELVEMSKPVLVRALEPFPSPIRTLDALHLATMDFVRRGGESIELASYDARLIAAAQAIGIAVEAL